MKPEPIPLQEAAGFGVVVLAASAGGQAAILAILRDLPLDFDVPIVVVQHLPVDSEVLRIYAGRLQFSFELIDENSRLAARKVLVCPARTCAELLPDGGFRLERCEGGALAKQIDRMLRSIARSFGHRAIGVILTGMGNDGAAGARELHDAGGRVLVQTDSSADFPEMPRAAVRIGAADLVVPLGDMAQVLTEFVAGGVRPKARSELDAIERVFGSQGDIATLAREIDWSHTPVGAALQWPAELRLIARTAMESPHPAAVWWGRELVLLYNEAYRRFLGVTKHPDALGRPAREVWREVWNDVGPMVERVMNDGSVVHEEDFRFLIDRHRFIEEIFANFAFSPIRDARGTVVGVFNTCVEATKKVVAERRLTVLRALAAQITRASTPRQVGEQAAAALASDPLDLPFALVYLFDATRRQASLAGAAGVEPGSPVAPHVMALAGTHDTWAMQRLLESDAAARSPGVLLEDLDRRLPEPPSLVGNANGAPVPRSAFVLPLRWAEDKMPIGAFVAGINPQRPFDDDCRTFVGLAAQQISAGLTEARARELEQERRDRLAELDRAKTEFFANVSHEFRTPLTLLLSPLEEIRQRGELSPDVADQVDLATRHARRLLRLVDDLLDFSEIEERRQRVALQPTDLASLTADVASAFRSAFERAGLALRLDCHENLPLVPLDPEMWEKIVSNLLSNALKFTFEGEVVVRLRALSLHVELAVSDTGIGIPKDELPNLFKRFHRVRGARARTIEGSGIGLALVRDLVSRMRGQLQVHSKEGRGTTFTVWMPIKSHRQTLDIQPAAEAGERAARIAAGLAEEAQTWVDPPATPLALDEVLGAPDGEQLRLAPGARVLVADDNADLRDYLRRLLGAYWKVTAVGDGAEALHQARRERPDLILADVMMPKVDGFALLRAVRADQALKDTPVVFLTARAGEDTAIEGLLAGADDYLAKPFSARELIARVGGQIALSRARRRTEELNAFLVRFSDAARGQVDPREIGQIACRMLHQNLGVERAYWAEVDSATREYVIVGGAHSPGVSVIEGRFPMDAWEPFSSRHRERMSHVVDDTQNDSRISEAMKAGYAGIAVGADLASPVVVDGELRCVLAVNQREPRHWTAEEIALVEGVAGRCWAEVERARGEAAARRAERRAEAILERISDAHNVLDHDFRIVAVNAAAERLLGQPRTALLGRSHWEAFPASVNAPVGAVLRRVMAEGVEQHLTHHYTGEGYDFHLELDAYPTDEGGIAMFWRDVTERVRVETTLRESEARLNAVFDASPAGLALADASGRVLRMNAALFRIWGTPPQPQDTAAYGAWRARWADTGEPLGAEDWAMARVLRTGQAVAGDVVEIDRFDGGRATIINAASPIRDATGNIIGGVVAEVDITAQWHAEKALRESESKYRSLFTSIDEGFCIVEVIFDSDDRPLDYRFLEVNPAFVGQTGIEDAVGRRMRDIAPLHEEHWFEIYGKVALTGEPVRFQDEAHQLHRSYDVYAFPVDVPERRRVGILFQDITERRRVEVELNRSKDLLQTTFDNSLQIIQLFKAVRDAAGTIVDFEWVLTNKQWNDRWGQMAGRRLLKENPTVVESGVWDKFIQVIESGVPITHQHYYAHEQFDGWFLQTIAKAEDGILLSTLDVSDLRRAELKWRERDERAG